MHSLRLLISARWSRGVSRHGDVGISRRAEPEAVGSIPGLNMAFHERVVLTLILDFGISVTQ